MHKRDKLFPIMCRYQIYDRIVVLDSLSGHYQVVTTWMGDCLQTGEPSRYITNTKINSAFHPSGVGKLSTGLSGWG